jgi:hypothetical protein
MRRLEEREPERDTLIHHPMPKDIDRATLIQLLRHPIGELALSLVTIAAIPLDQPLPRLALRRPDEREQIRRVHPTRRIEIAIREWKIPELHLRVPASGSEPRRYELLERPLRRRHAATPGISNSPETAAVINA